MRPQNGQQIIEHGPAGVHDVDPQIGMSNEHLLQRQGAVEGSPIPVESEIGRTWRADPDVNAYGNVELLGDGQIRFEERIAWCDAQILIRHLGQYDEVPVLVQAA